MHAEDRGDDAGCASHSQASQDADARTAGQLRGRLVYQQSDNCVGKAEISQRYKGAVWCKLAMPSIICVSREEEGGSAHLETGYEVDDRLAPSQNKCCHE